MAGAPTQSTLASRTAGRWACKQNQIKKRGRYIVEDKYKGRIRRWQDTILTLTQALMYEMHDRQYKLVQTAVKQWKGAWLLIWEIETSTGKRMKFFGYGQTLTECLDNTCWKVLHRKVNWKMSEE